MTLTKLKNVSNRQILLDFHNQNMVFKLRVSRTHFAVVSLSEKEGHVITAFLWHTGNQGNISRSGLSEHAGNEPDSAGTPRTKVWGEKSIPRRVARVVNL